MTSSPSPTSATSTPARRTSCRASWTAWSSSSTSCSPDIVLCTGDLTEMGFRQDYMTAQGVPRAHRGPRLVVIPGNHDARNVGYVHFEELIGPRWQTLHARRRHDRGVDSTEPDLDYGQIGRARYGWLREQFARPAAFRIFMLHHHLLPVPGTGRERNIVYDAGDLLEVLQECGVNLVLSGHKHVPVRLAARAPLRRQRRHLQLAAPAGQHQGLLQRRAHRRRPRARGAQVPVPRGGDAHRLRAVDGVVRQVHLPGARGGAAIGEPPAARRRARRRRALPARGRGRASRGCGGATTWSAGIFAGGREKLRGGCAAAPGLAAGLGAAWPPWPRARRAAARRRGAAAATPRTRCSTRVRAALRAARAEALVDLSDEPVVGYRERFLL